MAKIAYEKLVKEILTQMSDVSLAARLEVSTATIVRWRKGTHRPHRVFLKQLIAIEQKLNKKEEGL